MEHDDVITALVEASGNHDLTIIGATREGVVQKLLFGTIPETVAERAPTTVIMAKRSLDIEARLLHSIKKFIARFTGNNEPLEQV